MGIHRLKPMVKDLDGLSLVDAFKHRTALRDLFLTKG